MHRAGRPRAAAPTGSSTGSRAASAPGCRWPSPCSAAPRCWCSTSRPSASTRCCAATCGRLFHELADAGAALLVSSHVMDEADRCDRLLLMREGRLLADETLHDAARADRHRRHRGARSCARRGPATRQEVGMNARGHAGRRRPGPASSCAATTAPSRCCWSCPCADPDPAVVDVRGRLGAGQAFAPSGPPLLALIPFIVMFLVTSVTTLRERTSGTLERLLAMPMGKVDLLLGYALAFGLVAAVQSALAVAVSLRPARTSQVVRPGVGAGGRRRPGRGARHRAGPVRLRLRPHRVPGGAVHARRW